MLGNNDRYLASSGRSQPLGATMSRTGTNFALYSARATKAQLLIFKANHRFPDKTFDLSPSKNKTEHVWHINLEGIEPFTRYAYRLAGPSDPGNYFNFNKVLLDPYAKAIDYQFYSREHACFTDDNLTTSLRGIVLPEHQFNWEDDRLPKIPLEKTIVYELHPRGFTRHPSSQTRFPGTFSALQEKLGYLKDLGITTIELMPILAFDDDVIWTNSQGEEMINYWGYSPLSFFAFQPEYFSSNNNCQFSELKNLVKKAHELNLEIILDVVYNHTTEHNHQGPTLSWRGIDNLSYYSMSPADKKYNLNFTGCGNTLNANQPAMSRLIVDSLEYLAKEFHIDGFRFDLGTIFYFETDKFTHQPNIIKLINNNPVLRQLKLIAEPWDATGLMMQGRFGGPNWLEWNGAYRDRLRNFVNFGLDKNDFQAHLRGEAPEFQFYRKSSALSVNFVTAHDGFTLRDLVSYNDQHNWENGFNNTDGANQNFSFNYGAEGETQDLAIQTIRQEKAWEMLTYLFATPGVPMILMGDEMWRTQGGNNNAFCQDNSISWLNWDLLAENAAWFERVKNLISQH